MDRMLALAKTDLNGVASRRFVIARPPGGEFASADVRRESIRVAASRPRLTAADLEAEFLSFILVTCDCVI